MLSPHQITQFKGICSSFGVSLSEKMMKNFRDYAALLLEWNQRIHLVSKKDAKDDRIMRHFVDSLSIFKAVGLPNQAELLDLGSGPGFPAIPIKIVRDDVKMTLVESIHKKTLFLRRLSDVLKLENTAILNQRAEGLSDQTGFRERFDVVTAKAVGKLKDILNLGTPFLKPDGLLVAYKGKGVYREIREINSSEKCRIADVVKIEIPSFRLFRWLVIAEKVRPASN
jgi:16S rRNA (guanine527-N7)-methyltransferase